MNQFAPPNYELYFLLIAVVSYGIYRLVFIREKRKLVKEYRQKEAAFINKIEKKNVLLSQYRLALKHSAITVDMVTAQQAEKDEDKAN
jgi:hypothetical protein